MSTILEINKKFKTFGIIRYTVSFFVFLSGNEWFIVPSVQQKSSGLKFSKSRTGSHVAYSCHHNSSRCTFPIYAHSWRFSVFHSLQSITPRIY